MDAYSFIAGMRPQSALTVKPADKTIWRVTVTRLGICKYLKFCAESKARAI